MRSFPAPSILSCLVLALTLVSCQEMYPEKLFLSKLLKSGNLTAARDAALVKWNQDSLDGIPTYSGYLTVNETTNSNLFFWFVPAINEDPSEAPIMLWLNGAPDTSSTYSLFIENGPFSVKKRGRITRLVIRLRKETWARKHSMLYIDNPVGTGFSFTESEEGYSRNVNDVTRDLYEGLKQFFGIFPDYSKQPFYIAGESYAGKYAPNLALRITKGNEVRDANSFAVNLAGIALGGPLTDPSPVTARYSDYFSSLGLIDNITKLKLREKEVLTAQLIDEGKFGEAYTVNEELISYFKNQTGYDSMTNALESRASKKRNYFAQYLNTTIIRTKIHVGNQTLYNTSLPALKALKSDMFRSYKSDLEEVINKGLKVLIYVGQYDLQTPHVAVSSFVDSLNFTEKANFDKAPRIIVRDRKKGDVSGYVRSAENFAYVILRNAGHHAPRDQSRWSREMIERFVKDGDYSI